ncbi:MAG TPA: DUF5103 domain-containing protein [Bacteroidales bacterium]|nr:DUF5103 domain-containing protein [Bacteroidales bacterium]
MNLKQLLTGIGVLCCGFVSAQDVVNEYIAPDVKSVIFTKKDFVISYPVFEIDEETPLVLSFDDLSESPKNYYYSITLCNSDWSESRLSPSEYSEGLFSFPLSDYQSSANTLVHYTHYKIAIPNDETSLKLPGNYVIKVFEDNNSDKPVLIKRFAFVDKKVNIEASIKIPVLPEYRTTSQQLDFTIYNPDFRISNPHQELKVVIIKNFDWNTALTNLKPLFIRANSLDYSDTKENLFIAGNEYRSFNINSRKYPSAEVIKFDYNNKNYVATLATDKPRNTYFFKEDINGLFMNENKDAYNPDNTIESDYFDVNFSLNANILPYDGDIYLYGGLTNFSFTDQNKMTYNSEKNLYENTQRLKQGYYDYQYVFIPKATGAFDETEIEGSFSETENTYFIFVYYRGFGERYDRLIGYKRVTKL